MYSKFNYIEVTVEDRVATITLNRPEVGNAFHPDSYVEVREAFEMLDLDEAVGAIVLTGKGKLFCAGGDIVDFRKRLDAGTGVEPDGVLTAGRMGAAPRRCSKPVIAMINGAAAGAGASLALSCDFRFMTPSSSIVMAFINLGFPGDTGGAYALSQLVGMGLTTELMMTGRPIKGEEAAANHLAMLAEEGKLEEATYKFAKRMANGPLVGYKWQKKLFLEVMYGDLEKATNIEAIGMYHSSKSEDFNEAVNAFLQKRKPVYKGK